MSHIPLWSELPPMEKTMYLELADYIKLKSNNTNPYLLFDIANSLYKANLALRLASLPEIPIVQEYKDKMLVQLHLKYGKCPPNMC